MPSIEIIILLLLAAFLAGWVDAIGGGGGLIHFPALLFGLPNASPAELLGTNKAAQVLGTASASITYFQKRPDEIKNKLPMAFFGLIGSILGAIFSSNLPRSSFEPSVFIVLILASLTLARKTKNTFTRIYATGVAGWILFQATINLGGVLGLLPITGVPLPLISYGGSSLLFVLVAIGGLLACVRNEPALRNKRQSAKIVKKA